MNTLLQDAFGSSDETLDINMESAEFHFDESAVTAMEADDLASAISQCESVQVNLENLSDNIAATLADGGLTAEAAVMARAAIDGTVAPLGANVKSPNLESFDEDGGRMAATQFSLESIGSILKEIWEGIKNFVKKYAEKLRKWFSENLSTAARLEKAAEALADKADAKSGTPKETKLSMNASFQRNMSTAKGDISVSDTETGLKYLAKLLDGSSYDGATDTLADALIDTLDGLDVEKKLVDTSDISAPSDNAKKAMTDALELKSVANDKRYVQTGTSEYLVSKPILGRKAFVLRSVRSKRKDSQGNDVPVSIIDTLSLANASAKKEDIDSKDVTALNTGEISTLATEVKELAKAVRTSKFDAKKKDKLVAKLLKVGDKVTKEVGNAKGDDITDPKGGKVTVKENAERAKAMIKSISSFAKLIFEPGTSIQRQSMESAKASYGWASKCLSNIKDA